MWSQAGLRSITTNKASWGNGFPVELFQILKDDAVKVLHCICLLLLLSHFSRVRLCATSEMAAHQVLLSLGFSRQEQRSGLPFPSPMHESEKWKWSRSVVSDSSRPHGLQPTRLFCPWDFPGKSTEVGCHCLQQIWKTQQWPQDWKRSAFIPIPKKGNVKERPNYHTIALISHTSKVNAQNFPSQASIVRAPRTSSCSSWI